MTITFLLGRFDTRKKALINSSISTKVPISSLGFLINITF
jgi:hypothetical protein